MKLSELDLPPYLYTEETDENGNTAKLLAPEKLVSWADQGRGDAIFSLCHSVYEQKLTDINAWEKARIKQLEDEMMASGDDEGAADKKFNHVRHYHTTREDIVREAELKRANVKASMAKQQAELEELVKEAREFISAYAAQQDEFNMLTYMLVTVAVIAVGYMCFY